MVNVLKSGFFTTVQDTGRFGYRDKGVPVSGIMDDLTVNQINGLLENDPKAAVLEITMTGPTLLFGEATHVVLGGAQMSATLNNTPIENHKIYAVSEGDILSYGKLEKGFRGYLAIKDGFKTDAVLGSKSMFFQVTPTNHISDGDVLAFDRDMSFEPKITAFKTEDLLDENVLEVFKGPEYGILVDKQLERIFSDGFLVSKENNRMAYQLQETVLGHGHTMLTSATLPGTVQLTPEGRLIILMKDGQTTGGYPRILQLSKKAIAILAQKKFSDTISFKLV